MRRRAKVTRADCEPLESRKLMTTIVSNTTTAGVISAVGESDTYEVTAAVGDRLIFSVGEGAAAASAFEPRILLIDPNGVQVGDNSGGNGANSAFLEKTVTTAGVYSVVVRERDNTAVGDYTLRFAALPHLTPGADPADGDGGLLTSNTTRSANITVGDFDLYNINAAAGDRLILSVGEGDAAAASFEPYVALYGPDGALIKDNAGGNGANSAYIESVATAPGVYNVIVKERDNSATSDYALHFAQLPNLVAGVDPADGEGGLLASNTTHTGTIGVGDFDLFNINAAAGDRLILSVGEGAAAASGFEPYLALYGPNGDLVKDNAGGNGANAAFIESVVTTPGVYNVLVRERDNSATSDYALHFVQSPDDTPAKDPADNEGGALVSGRTAQGTIAVGDLDLYFVTAAPGDRLVLSVGEGEGAGAGFEPYLALYGPDGSLIKENAGGNGANSAFVETVAVAGGVYNVVVRERDDSAAGDYKLYLAKTPDASPQPDPADGQGGALVSNTTVSGDITVGDLDLYTFNAAAGDRFIISAAEGQAAASGFEPYVAVYGPGGLLVKEAFGGSGANSAFAEGVAPVPGVYNVLVRERDNAATSDYALHFLKLPYSGPLADPADNQGELLTNDIAIPADLTLGDLDLYAVDVTAGEHILLTATEGPGTVNFEPYLGLYGPDGALVVENTGGNGATTAKIDRVASTAGRYYVLVRERDDSAEGLYTLDFKLRATVMGRNIFYNNSSFDSSGDDAAIAPDKQALSPNGRASFANYTSFSKGINGVMIDVAKVRGSAPSTEDFTFKAGTTGTPASWAAAAAPTSIDVRPGVGVNGSDRVVLIWADNAIRNQWLQVTMKANEETRLVSPDVFYFGNLVGETGNSNTAAVEAADLVQTRNAIRGGLAPLTSRFDYNRDGSIGAADLVLVRNNIGRTLPIFTAPALVAGRLAIPTRFGETAIRLEKDDRLGDVGL